MKFTGTFLLVLITLAVCPPSARADFLEETKESVQRFGRRILDLGNGKVRSVDDFFSRPDFLESQTLNNDDLAVGIVVLVALIVVLFLLITCVIRCFCCCCCPRRPDPYIYRI